MKTRTFARGLGILTLLGFLAACGDGSDSAPPADTTAPPASVTASIGAAGGMLSGPDGVVLTIPPDAVAAPVTFSVTRNAAGAPDLGGLKPITGIYEVTPHGIEFASSARIHIPFNPDRVPVGARAVLIRAQPGGTWEMLNAQSEGTNQSNITNALGADTPGLSFYTVGTCYTTADANVPGPDPLIACPAAHSLTLTLQDGSGVDIPVPNRADGYTLPVMTITVPTRLNVRLDYTRPPSGRLDYVSLSAHGTPRPADWPLSRPFGNDSSVMAGYQLSQTIDIDPATTRGIVRFSASVTTTLDAFYPGCLCFKPASWNYVAEIAILVIGTPAPVVKHTVGGTVSGLTGTGLVLGNNSGDNLTVPANASFFTFATAIAAGSRYSVSVLTQPAGQICSVTSGSGTVAANVSNVAVTCSVSHTIGGTVSGLTRTGLVLRNNGGDNRAVTADGAFTFATAIGAGAPYGVTVLTQPSGQTCTVQNGSGAANADVSNVAINCAAAPAVTCIAPQVLTNGVCTTPPNTGLGNWNAAIAVTAGGAFASEPALGASSDGYTTLAWVQYDTDQYNGYASRFDPANGWQGSELIENLATNTAQSLSGGVYSPRVAMGANQRAHIVFGFSVQPGSYHTGMARYLGSAWESQMLTFGSGNSNDHALSFTGDGNTALMMYSKYDGSRYAIRSQAYQYGNNTLASLSPDGGVSPGSSSYSAAAALGSSDAVGTWIAQSQFVYVNRFNGATQTWGAPVNLNASSTGNAYPPAITGNAGGNAAVVWLDLNSGYRVYASRLSGATWSTPVTLATEAEGAPRNFDSSVVSVATGLDTSGNTYFAWAQADLASPYTIRLYVSRCAIGQAMSACESRIQMDSRNDRSGRPGLAVAPNGDVWVAWVARTTTGSEVRIRQRDAAGWSAVMTLGSSSDTDMAPSIAIDGLNRVTVAWEGADRRIYVARHQ